MKHIIAKAVAHTKKRSRLPWEELEQEGWAIALKIQGRWNPEGKTQLDFDKFLMYKLIKGLMHYAIVNHGVRIGPTAFKRGMHQFYANNAGEDDVNLEDPQVARKNIEFLDLVDYLTRDFDEREKLLFISYCLENKKKFRNTCKAIEIPYVVAIAVLHYKILPLIRLRYTVDFAPLDKTKVSQDPGWFLEQREKIYRSNRREALRQNGIRKAEGRKKYLANLGTRFLGGVRSADAGPSEANLLEGSQDSDPARIDHGHQRVGANDLTS